MKIKRVVIIASVAVLAVAGAVIFFNRRAPQIRFETEAVFIGDIRNTITATGRVQPLEQVEVSTQVSGIIDTIMVDFNDKVSANQIIAILDRSVLQLQVAQSDASLSSAQSEFDFRKSLFERANVMRERNMISADDYEQVKFNFQRAENSLRIARIDNNRARTNLGFATIRSPIDGVVLSRSVERGQTIAASLNAPALFTIARDLTRMQVLADIDEADIGQIREGMRVRFTVDAWMDSAFFGEVQSIRIQPNTASGAVSYTTVITADNSNGLLLPGMTATVEIITSGVENVLVIPARALRYRPSNATAARSLQGAQQGAQARQEQGEQRQTQEREQGQNRERSGSQNRERGERSGERGNRQGGQRNNRQQGGAAQTREATVWVLENGAPTERLIQTGERSGTQIEVRSGLEVGDQVIVIEVSGTAATRNTTARNPLQQSGGANAPRGMTSAGGGGRR